MKSGKIMNDHTKGFQKSDKSNTTISYRDSGCGIQATVVSGGNQYHSNSFSIKDQARQEAALMASESLKFRYSEETNEESDTSLSSTIKHRFKLGDFVSADFYDRKGVLYMTTTSKIQFQIGGKFRDENNVTNSFEDIPEQKIYRRLATEEEIQELTKNWW